MAEELSHKSIKELREILARRGVDCTDCIEKSDVIARILATADKEPHGSNGVVHVHGQADFDKWLNMPNVLVCADFTATWCPPCKMMAPIFKGLADQYGKQAVFLHVDIDENRDLQQGQDVEGVPTFKFYKNKKLVSQFSGADQARLTSTVKANL